MKFFWTDKGSLIVDSFPTSFSHRLGLDNFILLLNFDGLLAISVDV